MIPLLLKVSRKDEIMQLIQTKTYSTQDIVHARYELDSQNQSKNREEIIRAMVDYLFSKGVKHFRVTYNLGYDQCDWDPNHLYDEITPETTEEEWKSLLSGMMENQPAVATRLSDHCLASITCRTGVLHCISFAPYEDALHVCEWL